MWDGVRARLDPITPDLRGEGSPGLDVMARDVLKLLDERQVEKAVLGGCSMGGYVAMALLRIAPERVAGLVLADTRSTADGDDARAHRLAMADRVIAEGLGWVPDALIPNLVAPDASDSVRQTARDLILARTPDEVAWAQRAMAARGDSGQVLAAVDVPALVLVGEHDALTPPQQAREMAGALRRGEYVELAGVGHLTPIEAPDAFADAVLDWRQRVGI
jgi:pimeloyl-ACP methyl ester carboxylesterase